MHCMWWVQAHKASFSGKPIAAAPAPFRAARLSVRVRAEDVKQKAEKAGDKIQEKASEAKDKAGSAVSKAAGKVSIYPKSSSPIDPHGLACGSTCTPNIMNAASRARAR